MFNRRQPCDKQEQAFLLLSRTAILASPGPRRLVPQQLRRNLADLHAEGVKCNAQPPELVRQLGLSRLIPLAKQIGCTLKQPQRVDVIGVGHDEAGWRRTPRPTPGVERQSRGSDNYVRDPIAGRRGCASR